MKQHEFQQKTRRLSASKRQDSTNTKLDNRNLDWWAQCVSAITFIAKHRKPKLFKSLWEQENKSASTSLAFFCQKK